MEIQKADAIKRLGVTETIFNSITDKINNSGIFGIDVPGFKRQGLGYRAIEFTKKNAKVILVSLSNVSLDQKDIYFKVNDKIVLVFQNQ